MMFEACVDVFNEDRKYVLNREPCGEGTCSCPSRRLEGLFVSQSTLSMFYDVEEVATLEMVADGLHPEMIMLAEVILRLDVGNSPISIFYRAKDLQCYRRHELKL